MQLDDEVTGDDGAGGSEGGSRLLGDDGDGKSGWDCCSRV